PRFENYVEIDKDVSDAFGIPVLKIHMTWSDNEKTMGYDMAESAAEMLAAAGATKIKPVVDEKVQPGSAIHELGIARMGNDRKTSVLNPYQQAWDVGNVFVMDGSSHGSAACQNPTLTIMAVAVRPRDPLLEEMKTGNVCPGVERGPEAPRGHRARLAEKAGEHVGMDRPAQEAREAERCPAAREHDRDDEQPALAREGGDPEKGDRDAHAGLGHVELVVVDVEPVVLLLVGLGVLPDLLLLGLVAPGLGAVVLDLLVEELAGGRALSLVEVPLDRELVDHALAEVLL